MAVPIPNLQQDPNGLTTVRFYIGDDPVCCDTDNRPLSDLHERDNQLQEQIQNILDSMGGEANILAAKMGEDVSTPITPGSIPAYPNHYVLVDGETFKAALGKLDLEEQRQSGYTGKQTAGSVLPVYSSHHKLVDSTNLTTGISEVDKELLYLSVYSGKPSAGAMVPNYSSQPVPCTPYAVSNDEPLVQGEARLDAEAERVKKFIGKDNISQDTPVYTASNGATPSAFGNFILLSPSPDSIRNAIVRLERAISGYGVGGAPYQDTLTNRFYGPGTGWEPNDTTNQFTTMSWVNNQIDTRRTVLHKVAWGLTSPWEALPITPGTPGRRQVRIWLTDGTSSFVFPNGNYYSSRYAVGPYTAGAWYNIAATSYLGDYGLNGSAETNTWHCDSWIVRTTVGSYGLTTYWPGSPNMGIMASFLGHGGVANAAPGGQLSLASFVGTTANVIPTAGLALHFDEVMHVGDDYIGTFWMVWGR